MKHSRDVAGYTWYLQIPDKLWVTNGRLGYRLQYRHRTRGRQSAAAGWWLTGNGLEERLSGYRELDEAMLAAAPFMKGAVRRST